MVTDNRITKVQEEYFEFCLLLLQKIPDEEIQRNELSLKMYQFRDELKIEIINYMKGFKGELIKEVEAEIEKLRITQENSRRRED